MKQQHVFLFLSMTVGWLCSCKSTEIYEELGEEWRDCYHILEDMGASKRKELSKNDFHRDLRQILSDKSLRMAIALNVVDELEGYIHSREDLDEVSKFIGFQEVINKVHLVELEISSLSAAVSCEVDKTLQLAWFLERKQAGNSQFKLTLLLAKERDLTKFNLKFIILTQQFLSCQRLESEFNIKLTS